MVQSRQSQKFLLVNPQQLGWARNCRPAFIWALWQIAWVLTFRTRPMSRFGTQLILNAKMLEVGVSLIVQKL
ncbi:hypothetical protein [Microcoleus sp. F4-D5]|uniref:hypothetical protein n=1 Tax=Microcoleus sp. F4-D5 TaxID=2818760 RepID=UPI002FD3A208